MSRHLKQAIVLLAVAAGVACLLIPGHTLGAETLRFGDAVRISATDQRALSPHMDLSADGNLHVLWVAKTPIDKPRDHSTGMNHDAADELYYRRTPTPGGSLGKPVRVNNEAGEVWGFSVSKPVLSVAPSGIVHVMFPGNAVQPGSGKAMIAALYTRSVDGGRSFSASRALSTPAGNDMSAIMHGGFAAAHAFGTLTTDTAGGVHAFWIDSRLMTADNTEGALFSATSRDQGETFATDRMLAEGNFCPCCQLAAAADGNSVFLTSRPVSPEGYRDSAVAVSADLGRQFTSPVRIGEGRWKINGCPLKRTAIAATAGRVFTAWYTAGQEPSGVYFARSEDRGKTFGPSVLMHPQALVSDSPSVAARDAATVLVAWHAKTGGPRRIFMSVSVDAGETFSTPVEVPAPAGTLSHPEVLADARNAYVSFLRDEEAWLVPVSAGSTRTAFSP